jgi:hypothetical protein
MCRQDPTGTYTSRDHCSQHCTYIGSNLLDEIQSYIGVRDATIATSTWNQLRVQTWRAQVKKSRSDLIARVMDAMELLDASVDLGHVLWVLPEPADGYLGDYPGRSLSFRQLQEVVTHQNMRTPRGVGMGVHTRSGVSAQYTGSRTMYGHLDLDNSLNWFHDLSGQAPTSCHGPSRDPSVLEALAEVVVRSDQMLLRFQVGIKHLAVQYATSIVQIPLPIWISTLFSNQGVVLKRVAFGQLSRDEELQLFIEVDVPASLPTTLRRQSQPRQNNSTKRRPDFECTVTKPRLVASSFTIP